MPIYVLIYESNNWRTGIPPRGNPIFGIIDIFTSLEQALYAGTMWLNERRHERAGIEADYRSRDQLQRMVARAEWGRAQWVVEDGVWRNMVGLGREIVRVKIEERRICDAS